MALVEFEHSGRSQQLDQARRSHPIVPPIQHVEFTEANDIGQTGSVQIAKKFEVSLDMPTAALYLKSATASLAGVKDPVPLLRETITPTSPNPTISARPVFLISNMFSTRQPPTLYAKSQMAFVGSWKVLSPLLNEINLSSPKPMTSV